MSSLLEGIDTTHVGEKKPGGGGATDGSAEEKSNAIKLGFAVVAVIAGVVLIVWQLTSGTKPGTVLPSSPVASTDVAPSKGGTPQRPASPASGAASETGPAPLFRGSPGEMPHVTR
jgi:hypothetical protein